MSEGARVAGSLPELVMTGACLPPRLRDLPRPPVRIYMRGELPRGPSVAIVGTRRASAEALGFARTLAAELAGAGVAILSGGAEGIDTAAHWGALDARRPTVVVAPCGFEHPYPAQNAALFRSILESGGAYLSLVPGNEPASPGAFFPRNGCLAALAHAVVLVEAPLRSGARNTTAQARLIGRPVLVVPAAPWHRRGRGCIAELRLGARAIASSDEVVSALQQAGTTLLVPSEDEDPQLELGLAPSAR